ncbi:MAG: transglutaminase domain-containing protein [Chitinophagaceae bacterium]|nr:transglutaminase domain-containing protein [Chitinophagaceae bacterium]
MSIQRATPVNELLAKLIFLILPTAFIGYFLLWNANEYYSFLEENAIQQALYVMFGMTAAAIFDAFRFRFIPTLAILIAGFYLVYKGLDSMATGEFDAFFISVQFLVFAILFISGWVIGYGFVRLRYWSVFIAALMLATCILLIAKSQLETVYELLQYFTPSVLYSVYLLYATEQIYSYKDKSQKFWWFMSRRLLLFGLLAIFLFGGVVYLLKEDIKETVANYGGTGKDGENSMLKKNKDGSFDIKEYSRLRSNLGRSNELLFCAHIDNFFEGTDIPNPLYLTAFYYTLFDTTTETFERDSLIPNNDLFEPDPGSIPLFFTEVDSSVIENSLATKLRKTVDVEIYNAKLSSNTYIAPNVGYFVQPIAVEKDFRDQFKSAFRTKSYVSELNSAYFIYNSEEKQLRTFQENRFEVLRKVKGYKGMDKKFMDYYTYMPSDDKFNKISELAHSISDSTDTPVDQVLDIRDYFLQKDENKKQIFTYTDNPGIPDIPSASKLMYFLFENKKGYCAYYAGATLFMLRALGIPSRIAVGFLTVDRSDKNKGWYWYYADQAHAWVQVYFPGYGWLDFDTTVGNEDAEQSPQPDGTPPMQPPRAWLAAEGTVLDVDTAKKLMNMKVNHIIFHDKEYKMDSATNLSMDMKIAAVYIDSVDVPLKNVRQGDKGTAVSYAMALKNMPAYKNEKGNALAKRLPSPVPVDELYLQRSDTSKPQPKPQNQAKKKTISSTQILRITFGTILALLLIAILLPSIIYRYYRFRHKTAKDDGSSAYFAYRAMNYYLHQLGIYRADLTPMQYATKVVDPMFGTKFTSFMNVYLKKKYANLPLNDNERKLLHEFIAPFISSIRSQTKWSKRLVRFINPLHTIGFYVQPSDETGTK